MKKLIFVSAWIALCFTTTPLVQRLHAQAPATYQFQAKPYPDQLENILQRDNIPPDSVRKLLTLARIGKPEVKLAFLSDRFYLVFDLTGLPQTYVMGYKDSCQGYIAELSSNGIGPARLSHGELLDCLLKYYASP